MPAGRAAAAARGRDRRVQPPDSDVAASAGRSARHVPRGVGRAPGRTRGGRVDRRHVPQGSTFMTIGPSMANIVQFYGHRKAYGLSVSPNPLNRNPSYEPLINPDRAIRDSELQYVVWDTFSAAPIRGLLEAAAGLRRALRRPRCPRRGAAGHDGAGRRARTGRRSSSSRCGREASRTPAPRSLALAGAARRGRREPTDHADRALRRADAGEPLVRQLLRHLSRRRRDPQRHLHAGRPARARAVRAAVPARRSPGPRSPPRRVASTAIQYARGAHGRLRPGGLAASVRRPERSVMGYYDGRDLPFYWNVADEYVLFDRFFAASPGGSVANHLFWVAGTPGDPDGGFGDRTDDLRPARAARDLVEVLRRGLRPGRLEPTAARRRCGCRSSTRLAYVDDPKRFAHIVDLDQYYEDLRDGRCPRSRTSRPAGAQRASARADRGRGRRWSTALINALAAQQRLGQLRVHVDLRRVGRLVRPRAAAAPGRGLPGAGAAGQPLRAPRRTSTARRSTHTSILRFIEDNWRARAARARATREPNSLGGAFDFAREPRAPSSSPAARARLARTRAAAVAG